MNFDTILTDVFEKGAERHLSMEDERAAIEKAKAGNSDATVALIYAYAPALRNAVAHYRYAGGVWAGEARDSGRSDDLRMSTVEGLIEAVHAFDGTKHDRLAAVIAGYVANSTASYLVAPVAFTVPQRTLTRFYGILRAAEGNVFEAVRLAPEHEMTASTFLAVLAAVRETESYDVAEDAHDDGHGSHRADSASPLWDGSAADVEDRILVEAAFRAVDTLERDVTRLAYGFSEYEPVSDDEVGIRFGLSRQKAQRVRSGALVKMRSALGVA